MKVYELYSSMDARTIALEMFDTNMKTRIVVPMCHRNELVAPH